MSTYEQQRDLDRASGADEEARKVFITPGEQPMCSHCDGVAMCHGIHGEQLEPHYACDKCCAHDGEDGYCHAIGEDCACECVAEDVRDVT